MRVYCRKSLTKYAEKIKDDWFRVTKASTRFYEEMFGTPYPFDKLDSIFCPDYAMGAMENVGCITYNDDYIARDENFTRYKQENIFNTICHEVSHQWFGNLVTMKWWDDLWLNEGFASWTENMAADAMFPAWNMWEQYTVDHGQAALRLDALRSSHPIQVPIEHAEEVEEVFDAIR